MSSTILGETASMQAAGIDASGFAPAHLIFRNAPVSGTVTAIAYKGARNPQPGVLYDVQLFSAAGTLLGSYNASTTGLSIAYSGGSPYVISNQSGSVFLTLA